MITVFNGQHLIDGLNVKWNAQEFVHAAQIVGVMLLSVLSLLAARAMGDSMRSACGFSNGAGHKKEISDTHYSKSVHSLVTSHDTYGRRPGNK